MNDALISMIESTIHDDEIGVDHQDCRRTAVAVAKQLGPLLDRLTEDLRGEIEQWRLACDALSAYLPEPERSNFRKMHGFAPLTLEG